MNYGTEIQELEFYQIPKFLMRYSVFKDFPGSGKTNFFKDLWPRCIQNAV